MSTVQASIYAPLPSTTRAVPVHLSYDAKSNRIAYPSGKCVYLRNVDDPKDVIQFTRHVNTVTVAKFAPSGYYIASADEAGNVKIWDCVGEGAVKGEYNVISGRINDLSWDAESKRIAAVGNGKEKYGHCFTADSGNTVGEISGHSAPISAVSIKPTRPFRAATVGEDGALVFLSSPPYKFMSSVRDRHSNFVRDVAFSKDGKHIVSVGADKKVVVYNGADGTATKTIGDLDGEFAHESGVFGVSWVDETSFVTCSTDATVKLWNVESGNLVEKWALPKVLENQHLGVVVAGEYIISLTFNGNLNYFKKGSEAPVRIVKGHQKSITALSVANGALYSGSYDGRICKWNLETGAASYISGGGHTNLINDLVAVPKSHKLVTSGWDDKIGVIDDSKWSDLVKLDSQPKRLSQVSDGEFVAVSSDNNVSIVDCAKGVKSSKKLSFDVSTVDANGSLVVIGNDKTFQIHFFSKSDLTPIAGHSLKTISKPTYIKISPDSQYIAVGDASGKIILYNISDKAIQTSRWAFHTARINSIAWRSDSKYIVSGSLDTNVIIYSVERPIKNIKTLNAHKDGVNAVGWTSDDQVVSSGADSAIKFWDVKF